MRCRIDGPSAPSSGGTHRAGVRLMRSPRVTRHEPRHRAGARLRPGSDGQPVAPGGDDRDDAAPATEATDDRVPARRLHNERRRGLGDHLLAPRIERGQDLHSSAESQRGNRHRRNRTNGCASDGNWARQQSESLARASKEGPRQRDRALVDAHACQGLRRRQLRSRRGDELSRRHLCQRARPHRGPEPPTISILLLVVYFCVMQQVVLEGALLTSTFAPARTEDVIVRLKGWFARHGGQLATVGLFAVGALLATRGALTVS